MHPSFMGQEQAFFIGLLNLITSLLNIIPIQYPLKVFAKTQRQHRAIEGLYFHTTSSQNQNPQNDFTHDLIIQSDCMLMCLNL